MNFPLDSHATSAGIISSHYPFSLSISYTKLLIRPELSFLFLFALTQYIFVVVEVPTGRYRFPRLRQDSRLTIVADLSTHSVVGTRRIPWPINHLGACKGTFPPHPFLNKVCFYKMFDSKRQVSDLMNRMADRREKNCSCDFSVNRLTEEDSRRRDVSGGTELKK